MDRDCSLSQVRATRQASQVSGCPPSCGCLWFSIRLYFCSGFVLDLAIVHTVQKVGLSHLDPSVMGRIRSIRNRVGIVSQAHGTRSLWGAERSFVGTTQGGHQKWDFDFTLSVVWRYTSNYFSFVNVHQIYGFLTRKRINFKTNQDHKPGSNSASAFSSPGNPFPPWRGGGSFVHWG